MYMASSSSQVVTTVNLKKYDVFISFRGDDTRFGFTGNLHAALKRSYLETYIDYRIEKGNQVWTELVEAIQNSTLFLVVFSENYASSTWCLNELVEIIECHKNGQGVFIIPVFYQIDPAHVRKQTGSYATALAKHKKQGKNMIQNWKNALSQVANLAGFDSTTYRLDMTIEEVSSAAGSHASISMTENQAENSPASMPTTEPPAQTINEGGNVENNKKRKGKESSTKDVPDAGEPELAPIPQLNEGLSDMESDY